MRPPQPSLTATLTASPSPTDTPTATWTPSETPSPTASATSTPTVDSVVQLTPPVGARPASPGASIEITAADMEVSASSAPVEARTEFPAGITRIYFFIRYRGMGDGVAWSRVLYRDGQAVQGQAYLWSQGQRGESFFFFGNDEGYPPGSYELRLFVGDHETSRFAFEVVTGAGQ